jgi:hypothetical protein
MRTHAGKIPRVPVLRRRHESEERDAQATQVGGVIVRPPFVPIDLPPGTEVAG